LRYSKQQDVGRIEELYLEISTAETDSRNCEGDQETQGTVKETRRLKEL